MFIGIDDENALVYEGAGSLPDRLATPLPTVSLAKLIERPEDWACLPANSRAVNGVWVFREDYFDAVTRTRRGRLYQSMTNAAYPNHQARVLPTSNADIAHLGPDGRIPRPLNIYAACTALLDKPGRGAGLQLALGSSRAASAWRILDCELTISDDVMLTLKSLSAFGMLPAIDLGRVPAAFREQVSQSAQRVLDSAFRESPSSVIEHCRDALQVFISRWLVAAGEDARVGKKELAPLAEVVEAKPHDLVCVGNLARVVARLHGGRGKTSERLDKGARELTEEDAELAVRTVGFALRDLGWAKS